MLVIRFTPLSNLRGAFIRQPFSASDPTVLIDSRQLHVSVSLSTALPSIAPPYLQKIIGP